MTCCQKEAEDERVRRFRELMLPFLDDAYRLAYFLMRNRTNAEDAVQECYLRAWRHFDTWHGLTVKPWLLAILRNVCYLELARRGKREIPADLSDGEYKVEQVLWSEPQPQPDSEMIDREQNARVREVILSLPSGYREIMVLRHFEDMSYREITEVTRVPIGTVMSRLARDVYKRQV